MLKLLVSVIDEEDAREAYRGGADIIDVKNPEEGALGANFPWVSLSLTSFLAVKETGPLP